MPVSTSHWGSFEADIENGRLDRTRPFRRDRNPSALTDVIPEAVYASSRVRAPAVREGWLKGRASSRRERGNERFVEVDWETALDLVSSELGRVRSDFGAQAIFGGSYGWSSAGRLHHARTLLHRMLHAGGGCVGQVTNYSYAAGMIILPHVVGNADPVSGRMTDWRAIAENAGLMVFFGGINRRNFQVSSGGLGEHSTEGWLRRAREAGVEFVSIGPDRLDSAPDLGGEWLPIRPNSDTALMLALSTVLVEEGLHDADFLQRCCVGFDRYAAYLRGETDGVRKDPEWAQGITGIPAGRIVELARRMAANRTMLTASWSLQRADHGEQPYWALVSLAAILGQIGLPGGGFGFGYGSINGRGTPRRPIASPRMSAGPNPFGFVIPVARVSDLLLEPGRTIDFNGEKLTFPDTKLVYWAGGNPFHHHQDLTRLTEGFRRPETVIVNEIWWTATARHADIVLPATTSFERNDIGASPADRYILAMPKLIDPVASARDDFDIFADLADRLGYRHAFDLGRSEMQWLDAMYEEFREAAIADGLDVPEFERFWKDGWYEIPPPDEAWTAYEDFRNDPAANPLATPSGGIEIVSERIGGFGYDDCGDHARWFAPREWLGEESRGPYPLHLISNQPATRLHSQLDNASVAAASKIRGREPIRMHPEDAAQRGLADGDVVEVCNDRGRCLAGLVVSEDIMHGVVQLATGAWYDPAGDGRTRLEAHGNPNVLTADLGTSRLAQGPSPMSTLVEVKRFDGALPDIAVFDPPVVQE